MGTPIPNHRNEEKGRGAGPVVTYRLTPEEIAALSPPKPIPRSHTKPIGFESDKHQPQLKRKENDDMADPKLTREQYLELRVRGKTRKEIAKLHGYTLSHLENYWLKKWGIKYPIQEEVAIAGAFAPAPSEGEPAGPPAPEKPTAPAGLIAYNTALEDLAAKIKRLEAERDDFASGILERDREISKLKQAIATVTEDFNKAGKVSERQWQERVKALEKSIAELEIEREMLLSTIERAAVDRDVAVEGFAQQADLAGELIKQNNKLREELAQVRRLHSAAEGYADGVPAEPTKADDPVNHPAHYTVGGIEAIDAIEAALTGLTGGQAYNTGAAIKYLWRWSRKGGAEDLRKARWYIERLLAGMEADAG